MSTIKVSDAKTMESPGKMRRTCSLLTVTTERCTAEKEGVCVHFGGSAALSCVAVPMATNLECRPEALRPNLSDGLPLSMTPLFLRSALKQKQTNCQLVV